MANILFLLFSCLLFFVPAHAQQSLSYYLDQAETNSVQIYQNNNLISANKFEIQRLKAEYLGPKVSVNADYLMAPYFNNGGSFVSVNPSEKAIGYDPAITNGGLYAALLSINQPLLNRSRFSTYSQQVLVQNQAYQYGSRSTLHELQRAVTDQYILAYRDQEQIRNSREIVELLSDQLTIAGELVKAGTIAQADYLLLSIEQKARQGDLLNYQTNFFNDLILLDTLAGISRPSDTIVLTTPEIILETSLDSASNFLRQYHLDSLNIQTNQRVTNVIYQPQLNLIADGGLNATTLTNLPQRIGFSAGLSLRWLIYDGHQKRLNQRKSELQQETVSFRRNRFVSQNQVRKQKILQAIAVLDSRIDLLQGQLTDYQAVIRDYRKLLATGQFSVINFVNTLKSFILLQNDLIIARSDRRTLINNYTYWNW